MNRVLLIGTIDSDFSVKREQERYRQKVIYVKFDLAVKRKSKSQSKSQYYDWIKCIAFGKEAEKILSKYIRGTKIMVVGHLQSSDRYYEIEEGETTKEVSKYMITVVIDEAEYVSREKPSDDNDGKGSEQIAKETNEEIYER